MKKPLTALLLTFSVSAPAEVTYEQLLQDPDNIELNQQYIREQLAAGELSQALVSIERVILLKPLDMDARLARAQVLFRLGNMTSAQQELEALDQLPLGDRLDEQVDQLLSEVIARQKRWSFEGNVSIGLGYDDNIGGHTDTGNVALNDGSVQINGYSDSENVNFQRSDYDATVSLSLQANYDLGNQTNDSVYASIRASKARGNDSEIKNNHSFGIGIGARINRAPWSSEAFIDWAATRRGDIQPLNSDLKADGEKEPQDDINVQTLGLKTKKTFDRNTLTATFSYSLADYFGQDTSNKNDSKTTSVSVSNFVMLNDSVALINSVAADRRSADKPNVNLAKATQNRDTISLGGTILWQVAPGHRLTASATVKKLDYKDLLLISGPDDPQPRDDQFVRDDTQTTYSLSYTLFGAVVDPSLKDLSLSLGGSRTQVDSNMITYDVTNNRYNATLNYRFGR